MRCMFGLVQKSRIRVDDARIVYIYIYMFLCKYAIAGFDLIY